jgi:succinate dehydrogenase/fumarate reductase flavoprotein subunit
MSIKDREDIKTDVLIIGSEGAGSRAAVEVARNGLDALIVTKGVHTKCGATLTADMDIDVPSRDAKEVFNLQGNIKDDEENFCRDMFEEGKFINNEEVVRAHCWNATKYVKELADWGMNVTSLSHSPGHRYPRGLESTGRSMMNALKNMVRSEPKVHFLENCMITNLLMKDGKVVGAVGLQLITGKYLVINAKAVIIATGGAMRLYPITTAPQELTGDGMTMAYEAGAELVDMEFPMFLPACLYWPESMKGADVSYTVSSSISGWWLNAFGERFMEKWDPNRMEMGATRDVGSIAQAMEILEGRGSPHGGIYVSFKHLPDDIVTTHFNKSNYLRNFVYGDFDLIEFGMDPRRVAWEAGPASHYWNGGIKIDGAGRTRIPGLFAAGEVQGGTMGTNRLSGNATTECVVFGALSGGAAAEYAKKNPLASIDEHQVDQFSEQVFGPLNRHDGPDTVEVRKKIQDIAFKYVGPIRDEHGLGLCLEEVEKLKREVLPNLFSKTKERVYNREWMEALEIRSMTQVLEIVARASLMRKESRGAMYRKDFPMTDNKDFLGNFIVTKKDECVGLEFRKVKTSSLIDLPHPDRVPYMVPSWKFYRTV